MSAETVTETEPAVETPAEVSVNTESERPSWLPQNFRSPEDLAKSFAESVRKISSQGRQLSELSQENEVLTLELESLVAARQEFATRLSAMERAFISTMAGAK
jgi:hypothetical protein